MTAAGLADTLAALAPLAVTPLGGALLWVLLVAAAFLASQR